MTDFQFASSYNVIEFDDTDTGLFVDDGTRAQLEAAIDAGHERTITIDDVYGVEFFIVLSKILMIHKSSPEGRYRYRLHNQAIEKEKAELGPFESA